MTPATARPRSIPKHRPSDYQVWIPSFKRAGAVTTHNLVPHARIVCHEFERDAYHKAHAGESKAQIVVIPDELQGNIARVRNWILDNADHENIVMMDDDYDWLKFIEDGTWQDTDWRHIEKMTSQLIQLATDIGTGLAGLNVQYDPKFYRARTPFSFLSVVLAPYHVHINNPLRYDESLPLKDDYDMWLQAIQKWHKTVRFNKWVYKVDHHDTPGGCADYRRMSVEREQLERLQKKWGKAIVRFNLQRSVNPVLRVPIPGI